MKKSIIGKVFTIVFGRPTQLWAYFRQTYLFYQTYILRSLFLNKAHIKLGTNVRIQALKSVTAESTALLSIGSNSVIYENARIEALGVGQIIIGENSIIGDARISSRSKITIGKNFLTSWNVFIQDFDPHPVKSELRAAQVDSMVTNFFPSFGQRPISRPFHFEFPNEEIVIGNNAWLGANVTILKGARIGDNCIIATGAVVIKGEYAANSILAGNPAKVVKSNI
jgi:acetyltransferase-like isoleucine patch superfamily enzyme